MTPNNRFRCAMRCGDPFESRRLEAAFWSLQSRMRVLIEMLRDFEKIRNSLSSDSAADLAMVAIDEALWECNYISWYGRIGTP